MKILCGLGRGVATRGKLAEEGMIAPSDLDLFCYAESAEEAWARLVERGAQVVEERVDEEHHARHLARLLERGDREAVGNRVRDGLQDVRQGQRPARTCGWCLVHGSPSPAPDGAHWNGR